MANPNPWTEIEDDFIRANRGKLSSMEMARALPGRSRNAVIGRAGRLGLERIARKAAPRRPKTHAKRARLAWSPEIVPLSEVAPMPVELNNLDWWELNTEIWDLQPWHCREVVGQDGATALFCGHAVVPDCSYCERHRSINITTFHRGGAFVTRKAA
jgi:hypothetical protein